MDISFLIPTNRPKTYINEVINSINSQKTKFKYEICVYSQEEVKGENVVHYDEYTQKGPIYGFNYLAYKSRGDYIICLTDDHVFSSDFDSAINLIESDVFLKRRCKICSLSTGEGGSGQIPQQGQRIGSVLRALNKMPQVISMRFPVIRRDTLNFYLNGFVFHPEFRYHAGDLWLGYFLWTLGEPGLECTDSRLIPTCHMKNMEWEVVDCNTYYALMHNFWSGFPNYVYHDSPEYFRGLVNSKMQ